MMVQLKGDMDLDQGCRESWLKMTEREEMVGNNISFRNYGSELLNWVLCD